MAEICCGTVSKSDESSPVTEPAKNVSARAARRRRMEIRQYKFVDPPVPGCCCGCTGAIPASRASLLPKRKKVEFFPPGKDCTGGASGPKENPEAKEDVIGSSNGQLSPPEAARPNTLLEIQPRYGIASVCGRRRDMEDAVSVRPCFLQDGRDGAVSELHYFGVYDGHGCSHVRQVATRCRERLHEIVKEVLEK